MMLAPAVVVAEEATADSSVLLEEGWEDASYVSEKYQAAYAGSMYQIIKETIEAIAHQTAGDPVDVVYLTSQ